MGKETMVICKQNTQSSVEANIRMPLVMVPNKEATFKQLFGNLEEWVFEVGIFRFMLNPVNRRWLFWDGFHDSWEDTGYYAGEVTFIWDGEKLLTPKATASKVDHAHEALAKMVSIGGSNQEHSVLANTLIGNERNCDITIADTDAKAIILQHVGGYTFFAMGEKDTIFVNSNAVPPEGVLLHNGDQITIGKTQFDFIQNSQPGSKSTEEELAEREPTQKSPSHTTRNKCQSCHADLEDHVKFCTSCGTKVRDKPVKPTCPGCGVEVDEGLKFCTNCGQKL